jgi:hypothetical protein
MPRVNSRSVATLALTAFCFAAKAQSPAGPSESFERVRRIILDSQHLGAHGMGYNDQSLSTLAKKLTPADIPVLMDLLSDQDLRIGIQFALASQCEAALVPVRDAALAHKMPFFDAQDAMTLAESFAGCPAKARQGAAAMRSEIRSLSEAEHTRMMQKAQQKAAEDARIQRNALKLMDPKQAKDLTRQEREEVFRRSLKAMGLTEDGPMTPAQKDLVQRMYRTMVLGESGNRPPNQ